MPFPKGYLCTVSPVFHSVHDDKPLRGKLHVDSLEEEFSELTGAVRAKHSIKVRFILLLASHINSVSKSSVGGKVSY